ncbi:hypothetical protein A8713_00995 [Streptomyces sp. SAT1]|nr:hypothetical protein A8713_00995 [Streptomyces sp. SAT1]
MLLRAARGARAGPTPSLEQALTGLAAPDTDGTFAVQTASQCADRSAASRDPETYHGVPRGTPASSTPSTPV